MLVSRFVLKLLVNFLFLLFKTIRKLIDSISLPVTNLASKALRLEYEEYKQREELKEERKKLVKPEDFGK